MVNIKEIFSENKGVFVIAIFTAVLVSAIAANPAPAYAGADPTLGEIMYTGFNFAPRGYAFCDGQILPINPNQALFSLLGTTYGGDGRTSFALPDMRGRSPIGEGDGAGLPTYSWGQRGGTDDITLNILQMPTHSHNLGSSLTVQLNATSVIGSETALIGGTSFGASFARIYSSGPATLPLHFGTLVVNTNGLTTSLTGSGTAHDNHPPSLALSCNIALVGVYPSRN